MKQKSSKATDDELKAGLVEIERILNAPIEKVWEAITDKDQMKEWYFDLEEFKAEVGFEFQFYGQGKKGEQYLHLCQVTEVIPQKKLTYSWSYLGWEGLSHVTFHLEPQGSKTLLRLTHTGLGSFPVTNPDLARENFNEGWTELITSLLPKYLEKSA